MAKSFSKTINDFKSSISSCDTVPFINFSRGIFVRAFSSNDKATKNQKNYILVPKKGHSDYDSNSTEWSRLWNQSETMPNLFAVPYFLATFLRNGLFQGINAVDNALNLTVYDTKTQQYKSSLAAKITKGAITVILGVPEGLSYLIARGSDHILNGIKSMFRGISSMFSRTEPEPVQPSNSQERDFSIKNERDFHSSKNNSNQKSLTVEPSKPVKRKFSQSLEPIKPFQATESLFFDRITQQGPLESDCNHGPKR